MSYITIGTPPFKSIEMLEKLMAQVGYPEGLQERHVGTSDDELCIVSLWESKAHADEFFVQTLGPALAKALGPEPAGAPKVTGVDVTGSYVREPAH